MPQQLKVDIAAERDELREQLDGLDTEAKAIGECVDAIDSIGPTPHAHPVLSLFGGYTSTATVKRVLTYLARRYQLPDPWRTGTDDLEQQLNEEHAKRHEAERRLENIRGAVGGDQFADPYDSDIVDPRDF